MNVIKVKDFDMERKFWILQVSPILSCESLKMEELS